MNCAKCNTENSGTSKFCPGCGVELVAATSPSTNPVTMATAAGSWRIRKGVSAESFPGLRRSRLSPCLQGRWLQPVIKGLQKYNEPLTVYEAQKSK